LGTIDFFKSPVLVTLANIINILFASGFVVASKFLLQCSFGDRCYDFLLNFAKKNGEKIAGSFCKKNIIRTLFFEKNGNIFRRNLAKIT
jgi:hypothetical protein